MPERDLVWLSLIRPASSTVWPLATATELRTLRVETVGVSVLVAVEEELVDVDAATGLEISCSTSSLTLPFALIRGTTRRMMPVLR